jgi:hypothetical protein
LPVDDGEPADVECCGEGGVEEKGQKLKGFSHVERMNQFMIDIDHYSDCPHSSFQFFLLIFTIN